MRDSNSGFALCVCISSGPDRTSFGGDPRLATMRRETLNGAIQLVVNVAFYFAWFVCSSCFSRHCRLAQFHYCLFMRF